MFYKFCLSGFIIGKLIFPSPFLFSRKTFPTWAKFLHWQTSAIEITHQSSLALINTKLPWIHLIIVKRIPSTQVSQFSWKRSLNKDQMPIYHKCLTLMQIEDSLRVSLQGQLIRLQANYVFKLGYWDAQERKHRTWDAVLKKLSKLFVIL